MIPDSIDIHPEQSWSEKWTGPQLAMIAEHHKVVDGLLRLDWKGPEAFCAAYENRIKERGWSGVWDDED
jgi:hypothetical protein